MSTRSTYYLNGPSLGSATAVFTDSALTTCAPDGYYSDGTISRQQVSCTLLPQQSCDCSVSCGFKGSEISQTGVYNYSINTGMLSGAIPIHINNVSLPIGIIAEHNGITYNYINVYGYGYSSGSISGQPTYFGYVGCDIAGNTFDLNSYVFNGSAFNLSGTESISITGAQLDLNGAIGSADSYLIIPKSFVGESIVTLKIIYPCPSSGIISAFVDCPINLIEFTSSNVTEDDLLACSLPMPNTYYYYSVSDFVDGVPAIWDLVFSDINGQYPLADGFYHCADGHAGVILRVQNGVVINKVICG